MKRIYKLTLATAILVCALAAFSVASSAAGKWIGSWSTAMTNIALKDYGNISFTGSDITGRTVITPTASGSKVRLRFSNHYGTKDVKIDSICIADSVSSSETTSAIDVNSIAPVTFGGKKAVTIPAGAEVVSDAIAYEITAFKNVAISYYVKDSSEIKTMGLSGGATYLTTEGDKTSQKNFNIAQGLDEELFSLLERIGLDQYFDWSLSVGFVSVVPMFSGMDVLAGEDAYSVCVIGDSTVANNFPLYLAENIKNKFNTSNVGVMGKGIIGNTLATVSDSSLGALVYGETLLDRLDRDCLKQSGVEYVLVKIGANDIMHPVCTTAGEDAVQPSAKEIIDNLKTVCERIHASGKKVILGTITQWKGTTRDYFGLGGSYIRTEDEFEADWAIAQEVNSWIKSADNTSHDGYFDFADISKSSADPDAFDSDYSSDHIHPNDTLQRKWGNSFNMSLIGVSTKLAQIKLSASKLTVDIGKTQTIKVVDFVPSNAENKAVTWKSSDEEIATVTADGVITALKNGSCTITCKAADGSGVTAKCKVTVITPVESVTVTPKKASIFVRDTVKLSANVLPSNATNKAVSWSTSNKNVATVSSDGVVTAVKSGKVTITAKTKNGGKTATASITVKKRVDVTAVEASANKFSLFVGGTKQLSATVYPTNATNPKVKWSSSDKTIAKVNSTGKVTAVKGGTCKITVKSVDNPLIYKKIAVTVYAHASGVKLSPVASVVTVGYTKQLKATLKPNYTYNQKVTYSSSDKSVATVSATGLVKAKKVGTAVITVKTDEGGFTATSVINVIPVVKSTSVKLNVKSKSIYAGKKYTLKATVSPDNATEKGVTWVSTNPAVAKVSSKGVVTAKKAGTATIICTAKDSGKTAKCVIKVKNIVPKKVTLNKTKLTLKVGSASTLKATVTPSNATIKKVTWKSSDTSVAKVSSSGKITAVKPGKCTITCTTQSGQKVAKCTVTVKAVKVKSIKLSAAKIALAAGRTRTLKATVAPSNVTVKGVTWRSSNTSVATVSANGTVTAVKRGRAVITCTAKDGSKVSASCTVVVID